jgi:hypothetical protein
MIPQIQSLISAARRKGACAQALATLEAAESLDQLEQEGQLFVWIMWASERDILPKVIFKRYQLWVGYSNYGPNNSSWIRRREEIERETIRAARLWVETGALS